MALKSQRQPDYAVVSAFVNKLYYLSRRNKHLAIDAAITFLDDTITDEEFATCDEALRQIDVDNLDPSVIVSILGITSDAGAVLGEREGFFSRAMARLVRERGRERAERLLDKYH